jgi:hypothetical protein
MKKAWKYFIECIVLPLVVFLGFSYIAQFLIGAPEWAAQCTGMIIMFIYICDNWPEK